MPFTARHKAKCVLWFAKLESVTSVQRRFRQEYRVTSRLCYGIARLMATGAVEVDQLCGLQILQTSHHPTFFFWVL